MYKITSISFLTALALLATTASAQDSWQGAYPPPPPGNYDNYSGSAPYGPPPWSYNRNSGPAPYGPPPGYNRNSGSAPYGPPPRYYGDNRNYRGGPPRGYRSNRYNNFPGFPGGRGNNFFGFPGGWGDDNYGDSPWSMRTFTDPERFWDDMLATPDYLPTMPGGWNVPSVSMPNPVEVGREIAEQAPDAIDVMRDY